MDASKDHSKFTNKIKNLAQSDKIHVSEFKRVAGVPFEIYKKLFQSSKFSYVLLSKYRAIQRSSLP